MTNDPSGATGAPRRRCPLTALAERRLPCLFLLAAAAYGAFVRSEPIGAGRWSPLGESAIVAGDSESYREFGGGRWASRWAGYPVFLDLVGAFSGSPEAVPRARLLRPVGRSAPARGGGARRR